MDRIAFSIFGIDIYWYGFLNAIAAIIGFEIAKIFKKDENLNILGNYMLIGLIFGARLGYFLFYNPQGIADFFYIRQGGLAFHGAFLGVALFIYLYSLQYKKSFLESSDIVSLCIPLGLFSGRIGNYINKELIGRTSYTLFSSNIHAIAIYEAIFEGLILFLILFLQAKNGKLKIKGYISSSFMLWYGIFRSLLEFFRMPDAMIGFLTIGQFLSIPMIIIALIMKKFYIK